jgi:hypothetical protein
LLGERHVDGKRQERDRGQQSGGDRAVPCHMIAGYVDTRRSNTIFNWVIPIALVVLAIKRTGAVADAGRDPQEPVSYSGTSGIGSGGWVSVG